MPIVRADAGVASRPQQVTGAVQHLEKAVTEAADQAAKLQERLAPVIRTVAKPIGESLKREQMVPLAEIIENLACKVDAIIQRLQDTNEGLEL